MSYAYVLAMDNSDHQLAIDYDEATVGRRSIVLVRVNIY